jgi:hypothetical protein
MQRVFLSFPFRPNNDGLRDEATRLIESFDLRVSTGESLGGGALQGSILALVENADALVAFFAKTEKLEKGGWGSTAWVAGEFGHAKSKGKPAIALVEQGVKFSGPWAPDEHIPFRRNDPAAYLLRLAETLCVWKRKAGRKLKILLKPDEVAEALRSGEFECRYRLYPPSAEPPTAWQTAHVVPEPGGAFVTIRGFIDENLFEIEVRKGASRWRSRATAGWSRVEVESFGGGQ